MSGGEHPESIASRAWTWDDEESAFWEDPADEVVPVALRWKRQGRSTVLDLGCGIGRHSILFAEMGFAVDAYDLSAEGVRKTDLAASKRDLEVRTQIGDMLALPYADASFDALLALHVIYHTDMQGLQRVIGEIKRVLRPGGEVFITFNERSSPAFSVQSNRVVDAWTVVKTEGIEAGVPHTYVGKDDVAVLLEGFRIIRVQLITDYYDDTYANHFYIRAEKSVA